MVTKYNCQRCNNDVVSVYTRLCKECEKEIMEEYHKEQDKIMEEHYESIKRDSY